ncbi:hypothetical protein IEQ34_022507 [Dendrobium chrysotoxum]|uniref:Uncharacterized protein n=1 Tax=Dendrobium chrysotoxum TaxID=161865 RepID=A0AAV7FXW4_DENCH|nr:hypothetical protein IEQ34_022507 [Dendrobium chrysotoxum]
MATNELMEKAAELMATLQRNVLGMARRLRSATARSKLDSRFSSGRHLIPFVANGMRRLRTGCSSRNGFSRHSMRRIAEDEEEEEQEKEEVWKRTILMGEKCQPLEFSGAIYYDSKGTRVAAPPRSPLQSLFLSAEEKELENNQISPAIFK